MKPAVGATDRRVLLMFPSVNGRTRNSTDGSPMSPLSVDLMTE